MDLDNKEKLFKKIKKKSKLKNLKNKWNKKNLPNVYEVVLDFIQNKGLKLYGGQALHEHLKIFKEGLYKKYDLPDYDVYSPNAWEHAKELAFKLNEMGYDYVEARSSILNNEVHSTFKVSVDMEYILDLTQIGCEPIYDRQTEKKRECLNCGKFDESEQKCISIFNQLPANDLKTLSKKNKSKVYTHTYDYLKDKSKYPNKIFVLTPHYLKISLYRELSEPLSNPDRLTKIHPRLQKLLKYYEYDKKCDNLQYNKIVKKELMPVLDKVGNYIKQEKLINYGASAFNMFIGSKNKKGKIAIADYQVYSTKAAFDALKLAKLLNKEFPDYLFSVQKKLQYWKEVDYELYNIYVSINNKTNNNICEITQQVSCVPYIQINKIRYVSIERLKYLLYRATALPTIYQNLDSNPKNYNCILKKILEAEKKSKISNRSRFRQNYHRCVGEEPNKISENLKKRWDKKLSLLSNTTVLVNKPKNYITKIYPMPENDMRFPYRPSERGLKKTIKFGTFKSHNGNNSFVYAPETAY